MDERKSREGQPRFLVHDPLSCAVRGVELLALGALLIQPARIVHDADLTGLGRGAGADLAVRNL